MQTIYAVMRYERGTTLTSGTQVAVYRTNETVSLVAGMLEAAAPNEATHGTTVRYDIEMREAL